MRRAMRHTHILGATDPIIYKLVAYLIIEMGNAFPELKTHKVVIEKTIKVVDSKLNQYKVDYIDVFKTNIASSFETPDWIERPEIINYYNIKKPLLL